MTVLSRSLPALLLALPLFASGQSTNSVECTDVSLSQGTGDAPHTLVVGCGSGASFSAAVPQLRDQSNWRIYYRGSAVPIASARIDPRTSRSGRSLDSVDLTIDPHTPGLPDLSSVKAHELTVIYSAPGQTPTVVRNSRGAPTAPGSSKKTLFRDRLPTFTGDTKSADYNLTGSVQTAVAASPQYFWSAKASYPITLFEKYGTIAPTFDGQASQEQNADPDSLKLSATYEKVIAPPHTRHGYILNADVPGYEFERKANDEAVLVDGVAVKQKYQEKNTNLLASGTLHYITGLRRVNVTVNAGAELGSALSRSVRKSGTTTDSSLQIRRLLTGLDAYTNIPWKGKPRVTLDTHYILRIPFTPEPFTQAHVNDGNEFLTSKARHYVNLNANVPLATGAAITIQYKYGSLPPTFEFLDHQVTVGVELLLKNH